MWIAGGMLSPRRLLPSIILLVGAAPVTPDLAVRASPAYGRAPSDVRVVVRVAPNDENRLLRFAIDSGTFYRSSDVALAGAAASETHSLSWRSLPAGHYVVTVTLLGERGVRHVVTTEVDLTG